MDALNRGSSTISRVDSTLGQAQSSASRGKAILAQPAAKVALTLGAIAALGTLVYYASKV